MNPNKICVIAAGLPTAIFGNQNFQTFFTRKAPHHGD